ncbi:MAG: PHP domain-containing protein [Sedimentisphaerales bacterium]|nr:PHP domain-containing protein [Sedimentisphaerales bacterium]
MSDDRIQELEFQLDSFDISKRKAALKELLEMVRTGQIGLAKTGSDINLHIHSFYSYNACGYSPSKIAWLAKKRGLAVAGIVDFDVLDGLDEFLEAAKLVGLKACVGIESRVYLPEFADKEISSPGEPGISYHMGVGLTSSDVPESMEEFKNILRQIPEQRNRDLVGRINEFLKLVELDYDKDVLPLTPSGNATERHICLAYARKAAAVFNDTAKLKNYWNEKLGSDDLELPEGGDLQALIRAKAMKRGGVGYVQPGEGSFPEMAKMNEFVLAAGGIPTVTWLNGFSDGEQQVEKLIKIAMETGVEAINIIPDRNFTAGVKDQKLANLNHVVSFAESLDMPIIVGTEMNSPGLKFVDDFNSEELKSLAGIFLKGAHIVYSHSVMQKQCGLGYTSDWAKENFKTRADKKAFFEKLGSSLEVSKEEFIGELDQLQQVSPEQVLEKIN